mgnify:CR=1 FL=1
MIDALVGAVIMVVATTSLLYSIEVAEKAFNQAGQYSLNNSERELLEDFGLDKDASNNFWSRNIRDSRRQWSESIK